MEDNTFDIVIAKVNGLLDMMEKEDYNGDYGEVQQIIKYIKESQRPLEFRNTISTRLNHIIRVRNMKMVASKKKPPSGVIAQLTKNPGNLITLAALLCGGECQGCHCKFRFSGNSMLDVYAPTYCPSCNGVNIHIIKWDSSLTPYRPKDRRQTCWVWRWRCCL